MARLRVTDGENSLQIWMIAVNILNKQSRIAENCGLPARGLDEVLATPHSSKKKKNLYEMYTGPRTWMHLARDMDQW
jgi:hypothetical protein